MPPGVQPFQLPDVQDHAIRTEMQRHNQALYVYGEYAMFVLMWHADDFANGLCERCGQCYVAYGKIAEAFGQPAQRKCPECFGSSFSGVRAKLIRPMLYASSTDTTTEQDKRGEVYKSDVSIQTSAEFRLRDDDYVLRGDGTRWRAANPTLSTIQSGFQMDTAQRNNVGYAFSDIRLEDQSSVVYIIPPLGNDLAALLDTSFPRQPIDFSANEVINGPLIV